MCLIKPSSAPPIGEIVLLCLSRASASISCIDKNKGWPLSIILTQVCAVFALLYYRRRWKNSLLSWGSTYPDTWHIPSEVKYLSKEGSLSHQTRWSRNNKYDGYSSLHLFFRTRTSCFHRLLRKFPGRRIYFIPTQQWTLDFGLSALKVFYYANGGRYKAADRISWGSIKFGASTGTRASASNITMA